MISLVSLALILAAIWGWAQRQSELFLVSIRSGRLLVIRGRVPQGLLADYQPLVRHVKRGTVVARKISSGALLHTRGVDDNTTQRLRNLLGIRPLAQLVGAAPLRDPSIGQRLGVTWLAWWCARK